MKRITILVAGIAVVGLMAAACSSSPATVTRPTAGSPPTTGSDPGGSGQAVDGSGSGGSGSPGSRSGSGGGQSGQDVSGSGGTLTYQAWFSRVDDLFVVHRTVPATRSVGAAALQGMLAGPTAAEAAAGVHTQVPAGTRLLGLAIAGGVATVDLSSGFQSGGGTPTVTMRLAQLVYTITQYPSVDSVKLHLDGKPVTVFSSEGIVLDHPQTRPDYDELLPPILVESPAFGERVSSPVTISGTANVFEATVSIRILDANGREIAAATTTATCGTGCRGGYAARVSYDVGADQAGTIEVFESSAQDGHAINVVRIPVTLTA